MADDPDGEVLFGGSEVGGNNEVCNLPLENFAALYLSFSLRSKKMRLAMTIIGFDQGDHDNNQAAGTE